MQTWQSYGSEENMQVDSFQLYDCTHTKLQFTFHELTLIFMKGVVS